MWGGGWRQVSWLWGWLRGGYKAGTWKMVAQADMSNVKTWAHPPGCAPAAAAHLPLPQLGHGQEVWGQVQARDLSGVGWGGLG